jgi:hypothetical protein
MPTEEDRAGHRAQLERAASDGQAGQAAGSRGQREDRAGTERLHRAELERAAPAGQAGQARQQAGQAGQQAGQQAGIQGQLQPGAGGLHVRTRAGGDLQPAPASVTASPLGRREERQAGGGQGRPGVGSSGDAEPGPGPGPGAQATPRPGEAPQGALPAVSRTYIRV